jgi:hypothetical protein
LWLVPNDGTSQDESRAEHRGPSPRPDLKGGTGTDEPPDGPTTATPPRLGDPMYPVALAEAGNGGYITADEFSELYSLHTLVARSREELT